jgi:hypothetical protein
MIQSKEQKYEKFQTFYFAYNRLQMQKSMNTIILFMPNLVFGDNLLVKQLLIDHSIKATI